MSVNSETLLPKSMKKFTTLVSAVAVTFLVSAASAQTDLGLPDKSQAATIKQRVGVTDITINYHRPLVNGRKIWGALVPFGEVWRAGANENTTFEVTDPVLVEGQPLPKGIYGLHMIPTADSWTVIFSKATTAWGSYTYAQGEDALRVNVKPRAIESEEALAYGFEDLKIDSVTVTMKWEKVGVPFRVSVTDEETVLPYIRNHLRGRAQYQWTPLYEAAQYCLTKKVHLEEALKWADQSIANEERFENLSVKADILKAQNKPDDANAIWGHALEIANATTLYSYARGLQSQHRDADAMEIFGTVGQRYPQSVYGHLARGRIKSAAGDFVAAADEMKQAQAVAQSEPQKKSIDTMLQRLNAKQDINK